MSLCVLYGGRASRSVKAYNEVVWKLCSPILIPLFGSFWWISCESSLPPSQCFTTLSVNLDLFFPVPVTHITKQTWVLSDKNCHSCHLALTWFCNGVTGAFSGRAAQFMWKARRIGVGKEVTKNWFLSSFHGNGDKWPGGLLVRLELSLVKDRFFL